MTGFFNRNLENNYSFHFEVYWLFLSIFKGNINTVRCINTTIFNSDTVIGCNIKKSYSLYRYIYVGSYGNIECRIIEKQLILMKYEYNQKFRLAKHEIDLIHFKFREAVHSVPVPSYTVKNL